VFGIGQFDDLQPDTLCVSVSGGLFASVTLVNEGDLYRAAGHYLYLLGQLSDLGTILLTRSADVDC